MSADHSLAQIILGQEIGEKTVIGIVLLIPEQLAVKGEKGKICLMPCPVGERAENHGADIQPEQRIPDGGMRVAQPVYVIDDRNSVKTDGINGPSACGCVADFFRDLHPFVLLRSGEDRRLGGIGGPQHGQRELEPVSKLIQHFGDRRFFPVPDHKSQLTDRISGRKIVPTVDQPLLALLPEAPDFLQGRVLLGRIVNIPVAALSLGQVETIVRENEQIVIAGGMQGIDRRADGNGDGGIGLGPLVGEGNIADALDVSQTGAELIQRDPVKDDQKLIPADAADGSRTDGRMYRSRA